jgi:Fur family transcriptional regulator, ferric uptake regulator
MSPRRSSLERALPAPTDWPDNLRQLGLRATALTVEVLELLESVKQPCSHDELARTLASAGKGRKVDRVTLYRILERLTLAGLLTRLQGSDRVWRHAIAQPQGTSSYFECDHCHTLSALPGDPALADALARIERRLSRRGVRSTNSAVTIHGTCRDCSEQGYSH